MIDRHLELISRLTSTRRIFLLLLPTSEAGAESIGRLGRLEVFDASVAAVREPRDLAHLVAALGGLPRLKVIRIGNGTFRDGDLAPRETLPPRNAAPPPGRPPRRRRPRETRRADPPEEPLLRLPRITPAGLAALGGWRAWKNC